MSGAVLLSAWLVSGVCALTGAVEVELQADAILVRDAVQLECVAPSERDRIGGMTVAALSPSDGEVELARTALAALVRRRIPALAALELGDADGSIVFIRRANADETARSTTCAVATRAIAEGEIVTTADTDRAPCVTAADRPSVRYERETGSVRALRAIAPGEPIGAVFWSRAPLARTGDTVVMNVAIGPVRIARAVRALQPAWPGSDVFVRDGEDAVFAAPVSIMEPAP